MDAVIEALRPFADPNVPIPAPADERSAADDRDNRDNRETLPPPKASLAA